MIARRGRESGAVCARASALVGLAVAAQLSISEAGIALAGSSGDTLVRRGAGVASPGAAAGSLIPTDEPLRKGMHEIRRLVIDHHSLVTHRRLPPDMAVRFAAEVRSRTELIVAKSKVAGPDADALSPIIGKLVEGAEAVAGRKPDMQAMDGIFLMDEALALYADRFDHPSWSLAR